MYDSFVKTGNAGIDTILMSTYLTSLNNKIDFTYFIDGNILNFMDSEDVVSLFDNLIDNAINAVNDEEEKNRVIHLQCYKEKQSIFIYIRNYCSIKPDFYKDFPVTKKR